IRQDPIARSFVLGTHKLADYFIDETIERTFLEFFDSIREVLVTSHVIGQIKSRRSLPEDIYRNFMLSSMEFLTRKKMDERLITLSSIYENGFARGVACVHGPTDAGLVALARQEKCVLLTDDSRLYMWCNEQSDPEIELVEHIVCP